MKNDAMGLVILAGIGYLLWKMITNPASGFSQAVTVPSVADPLGQLWARITGQASSGTSIADQPNLTAYGKQVWLNTQVPGTGLTARDLQNAGYTVDEINQLIQQGRASTFEIPPLIAPSPYPGA